jgi:hypothetical protein
MKQYTLHLVPEDGATLKTTTQTEWDTGRTFVVLSSSLPMWQADRRGNAERITKYDVEEHKHYYDTEFRITFDVLSVVEKLKAEAADDYTAQLIVDTMVDGDYLILSRGQ